MENYKFEEEKQALYKEVLSYECQSDMTNLFKNKFKALIEKCVLSFMEGEDSFFGIFMTKVEKRFSLNLNWPIETYSDFTGFVMTFDPLKLLQLSKEEIKALIKHEIYHIMYGHYYRMQALDGKVSPLALNLAMDVSINQYIKGLPGYCIRLESVIDSFNVDLESNDTFEKYALKIQEAINKRKKKGIEKSTDSDDLDEYDISKAHMSWKKCEQNSEELKKRVAKETIKYSKVPGALIKVIEEFNLEEEINWKDYVKNLIPRLPHKYKKTITRKDRRQPERLDIRGKLRNHISQILIAVDISGSIGDKEIAEIVKEVFALCRYENVNITLAEVDDKVRRVYTIKSKKDLVPRLDNRGGTKYTPLFKYVNENGFRDHLIIYFTDGMGEEELEVRPLNYKTIWVLTGKGEKLSLKNPYGKVLRMSNKGGYEEPLIGTKVASDMLHEIQGRVSVLTFDI